MRKPAIQRVEAEHLRTDLPPFHIGDTVDVGVRIVEGDKERVQVFRGVVIARRGTGTTFTVRRIVAGEGVERTFPLHAPTIAFIKPIRSGKVRRAKLHYLRDRVGKATRLAEVRRPSASAKKKTEAAPPEAEEPQAEPSAGDRPEAETS